jgi:transposase-like protein
MHRNAPLTAEGRFRLCQRIEAGWTIAAAAESMNISRQTAHKWWGRFRESGEAGLEDRSSRPRTCPSKTSARMERRIVELRRRHQLGPARLAPRLGVPASTFHRVLQRHGVSRLSDLDRGSGRVIRRIETSRPGELVHIDVKKQAKIPRAVAGGSTAGKVARTTVRVVGPASATPTSIRPSTPTAVWPTRRSTTTKQPSPPLGSGDALDGSSSSTASPSRE